MGGGGVGESAEAFQRTWSFRFSTQRPSLVPIMRQLKNAKWKSYLSHTPDCLNLLISCLPVHGHFLGSFPAPASLCPGGFEIHAASLSLNLPLIQCSLFICQKVFFFFFFLALSIDQHYQTLNSANTSKNILLHASGISKQIMNLLWNYDDF